MKIVSKNVLTICHECYEFVVLIEYDIVCGDKTYKRQMPFQTGAGFTSTHSAQQAMDRFVKAFETWRAE